jgi:hypothetical protein
VEPSSNENWNTEVEDFNEKFEFWFALKLVNSWIILILRQSCSTYYKCIASNTKNCR